MKVNINVQNRQVFFSSSLSLIFPKIQNTKKRERE